MTESSMHVILIIIIIYYSMYRFIIVLILEKKQCLKIHKYLKIREEKEE